MKKEYVSPEFDYLAVSFSSILTNSVENFNSDGDDNGGSGSDWGDPVF